MKKTMFIYEDQPRMGEVTFFFDEKELISAIDGNDGNYRDEYMDSLFSHFKISVKRVDKLNKDQKDSLKEYCQQHGITPRKIKKEATEKNHDYFAVRLSSPFGYQDVLFYIQKDMPLAQEFFKVCKQNLEDENREYQGCRDIRFYFKEEALADTQERSGNYRTPNGYLSDYILVESIVPPSEVKIDSYDKKTYKLKDWKSFADLDAKNFAFYYSEAKCFVMKK